MESDFLMNHAFAVNGNLAKVLLKIKLQFWMLLLENQENPNTIFDLLFTITTTTTYMFPNINPPNRVLEVVRILLDDLCQK